MYTLGKFLQATGLVLPLIGLAWAFSGNGPSMGSERSKSMMELGILAGGAVLFFIGTKIVKKVSA